MRRWLKRGKKVAVSFCDRCTQVCTADCRSAAVRERDVHRALRSGVRF